MKKSIFILAISLFMAGTIITGCQSSAKKVENARENVADANQALDQAIKDSIQQFKEESAKKMSEFDKSIAEFRTKMNKEKKENKARYDKTLYELEQKNIAMKKKLSEYKQDGKDEWKEFKAEFNHDMEELGKALDDLSVKNVK